MLQDTRKWTLVIPSFLLLLLPRLHAVLQTHFADVLLPKASGDALPSVRDVSHQTFPRLAPNRWCISSEIFSKFDPAGDGFLGPVIEACERSHLEVWFPYYAWRPLTHCGFSLVSLFLFLPYWRLCSVCFLIALPISQM